MIKCLIWDLDDTLWEGTLSEDRRVTLRPGIIEVLRSLDARGVLLSIASRNDHEDAMEKLMELGLAHYFIYPQIGWAPKAEGIRRIVSRLNIGVDAAAFIDDNPFEREEARACLPGLAVYEAGVYGQLPDLPEFQAPAITGEAGRRRELMLIRAEREDAERQFPGTREEFLRSCSMELMVRPARQQDSARVYELAARTNQWNNGLERVSQDVVRNYMEMGDKRLYVAELKDRFGDHGIVAVAMLDLLEEGLAEIRLFCISCRIEGRGIGNAFLGTVLELLQLDHPELREVRCGYKSESRNRPALMLLKLLGFTLQERKDDFSVYGLPLPVSYLTPDWIHVHSPRKATEPVEERNGDEVERRVISLVAKLWGRPEVGPETVLLGGRGILDSVTAVQLIAELENEFRVVFDEDDLLLESLSTVKNVVRFIEAKLN